MGENEILKKITVFTQNSIRVDSSIGKIYIDPFRMNEEPGDADYILVTHDHYDHFNPEDIPKVSKGDSILVVPENMKEKAKEVAGSVGKIVTVKPGESVTIDKLNIETIPSYNIGKPFHPKEAGWVGYILNVDGKRIFIAGDTDATDEAKKVKCDIELVPVGGTYTMDTRKAADLINTIRPEYAIPTHYGSIVGKISDGKAFCDLVQSPVKTVEKIEYFE
jgi:L-ascorbate metabolism protein UlaG (beta-lactamase superfamily)